MPCLPPPSLQRNIPEGLAEQGLDTHPVLQVPLTVALEEASLALAALALARLEAEPKLQCPQARNISVLWDTQLCSDFCSHTSLQTGKLLLHPDSLRRLIGVLAINISMVEIANLRYTIIRIQFNCSHTLHTNVASAPWGRENKRGGEHQP